MIGVGPLPGRVEGEDVADGEGGVIGGGAGPDDLQGVSVLFPEAQVEAVGALEVLPDRLAGGVEGDVHRGAGEGGGVGGLLGLELEASGDLRDLDVDGAGGGVAEGCLAGGGRAGRRRRWRRPGRAGPCWCRGRSGLRA